MILLWLLGAAAATYVAAKIFSGSSSSNEEFWQTVHTQEKMDAIFNTPSPKERFMDDLYYRSGYGDVNFPFDPDSKFKRYIFPVAKTKTAAQIELEYLGETPYTAKARVGAIMKHVAAYGAAPAIETGAPTSLIAAFAKNSYLRISQLANSITATYAD